MQRSFKRSFRHAVPGFLKRAIKRRLQRRLSDGEVRDVQLKPAGDAIRCVMGEGWSFLVPERARDDLLYHTATREGLAELSGLARVAEAGGIVFDVGAHAGLISVLFGTADARNRVFSFEPSPIGQERLRKICALNGLEERMTIEPMAIGRARAKVEMLLDPAGGFVQERRFAHSMLAEPQRIDVAVENLGDAAARLNVIPDCIKIDIEGYEDEAIFGAHDFLARHRPLLLIELHLNYLEEKKVSAQSIVEALSRCGYTFATYGGTALRPEQIYSSPLPGIRFMAQVGK